MKLHTIYIQRQFIQIWKDKNDYMEIVTTTLVVPFKWSLRFILFFFEYLIFNAHKISLTLLHKLQDSKCTDMDLIVIIHLVCWIDTISVSSSSSLISFWLGMLSLPIKVNHFYFFILAADWLNNFWQVPLEPGNPETEWHHFDIIALCIVPQDR